MGNSCRCQCAAPRSAWIRLTGNVSSLYQVVHQVRYKSSQCRLATLLAPPWKSHLVPAHTCSQKEMKGKSNGLMSDSNGAIRDDYFFQTREIQLCLYLTYHTVLCLSRCWFVISTENIGYNGWSCECHDRYGTHRVRFMGRIIKEENAMTSTTARTDKKTKYHVGKRNKKYLNNRK